MTAIQNRYEFVYLFDVTNGNPNGDPDAGNMPRLDPETSCGLVSDVCLKRKIRNYVDITDRSNCEIFIQEKRPLNPLIAEACEQNEREDFKKKSGGWDKTKAKARSQNDIRILQAWLCEKYYDIRTFGAVLSTGPNAGQIRGPAQMTFAQSLDPILPLEQAITRVADTDKEEGEMGRKYIVPYGLYRGYGFISAKLAEKTGFSEDDLSLFWEALQNMFDHDRSAARGQMVARKLFVFKHECSLGNAPAHTLFDRITVKRVFEDEEVDPNDRRVHNYPPARRFDDYVVRCSTNELPPGVELIEKF